MTRIVLLALCVLPACGGSVTSDTTPDASVDAAIDSPPTDTAEVGPNRKCSMAGMCTLVPASCCGTCGAATKSDEIALPREEVAAYHESVCKAGGAPSGCPDCAAAPNPELQAFCRDGECAPVFIPADSVSECATDADCEAVQGICCGPCDDTERSLVAVAKSKKAEVLSQICDPRVDCTTCPLPSPIKSTVRCDPASRHCIIMRP